MPKKNRTLLQRAAAIFDYLDTNCQPYEYLAKSTFQKIGISPREMDRWLELIIYIQSMPYLTITKERTRTYVGTLENKFMLLMRKNFLDQKRDIVERESAVLLYFKILLNHEKLRGEDISIEEIIAENWMLDRPTIRRIAKDAVNQLA